MTDEKLLAITKRLYDLERSAIGSGYPARVEYAVIPDSMPIRGNAKDAENKRKALFGSLSDEELTEIRTILAVSSYNKHNQKGMIRYMLNADVEDLKAWQKKLGVETLSREESLKELDKRSTSGIAQGIECYLRLKPMNDTKRNLMGISILKSKR